MHVLRYSRLPKVAPDNWARVREFFASERQSVMPHELANSAGITAAQALAILDCLASDGVAEINLLVYHDCTNVAVRVLPFGSLPDEEFVCDECDDVLDDDTVTYDLMAKVSDRISVEP